MLWEMKAYKKTARRRDDEVRNISYIKRVLETEAESKGSLNVLTIELSTCQTGVIEGVEICTLLAIEQCCICIEGVTTIAYAAGVVVSSDDILIGSVGLHGVNRNHLPCSRLVASGDVIVAETGVEGTCKHFFGT